MKSMPAYIIELTPIMVEHDPVSIPPVQSLALLKTV